MSTCQETRRPDLLGSAREQTTQPGVRPFLRRLGIEVGIVGVLFVLYNAGRLAITGQEGAARANAVVVRRLESALHLPSEAALQSAFASVPRLFELANHYYVAMHFPVVTAFLLWGFVARPRAEYLWARNLLVTMTFLGLVVHSAFPLAPPRMFPQWGFLDTMARWGPSPYDGASAAVANQYAAMPSLHIGWAILIAFVLARTGPRSVAVLGTVHAAATVFVVVVTANHWWVDGVVAGLLLAIATVVFPRPGVTRRPRRRPRGAEAVPSRAQQRAG